MLDIEKYVTIGEDGKPKFDKEAYQSAFDAEIRKSVESSTENLKKKLSGDIRKQLEEEAKLSAEEKLKQEREAFENEKFEFYKTSAQEKAKSKMLGSQLFEDEEEIATILELVSDDAGIAKVEKLIASRQKMNEKMKKSMQSELIGSQPNPQDGDGDKDNSLGAIKAKQYQNKGAENQAPKVTAFGD